MKYVTSTAVVVVNNINNDDSNNNNNNKKPGLPVTVAIMEDKTDSKLMFSECT